jgi:hypothetical protein
MSNKYCSSECDIFISVEKIPDMREALIQEASINWGRDVNPQSSLEEVCDAFSWQISLDSEGNANHVLAYDFLSYGLCDREKFLEIISPFVKDGSFVEMHGEDGDVFRIVFQKGKMRKTRPAVLWD